jgi:hypothetical protein
VRQGDTRTHVNARSFLFVASIIKNGLEKLRVSHRQTRPSALLEIMLFSFKNSMPVTLRAP